MDSANATPLPGDLVAAAMANLPDALRCAMIGATLQLVTLPPDLPDRDIHARARIWSALGMALDALPDEPERDRELAYSALAAIEGEVRAMTPASLAGLAAKARMLAWPMAVNDGLYAGRLFDLSTLARAIVPDASDAANLLVIVGDIETVADTARLVQAAPGADPAVTAWEEWKAANAAFVAVPESEDDGDGPRGERMSAADHALASVPVSSLNGLLAKLDLLMEIEAGTVDLTWNALLSMRDGLRAMGADLAPLRADTHGEAHAARKAAAAASGSGEA